MTVRKRVIKILGIVGSVLGYWFLLYFLGIVTKNIPHTLFVGVIEKIILSLFSIGILCVAGYKSIMKKVICEKRARIIFLILNSLLIMKLFLNIFSELCMPNNHMRTMDNMVFGVILCFLTGVAEEVLFRGYILHEWMSVLGENRKCIVIIINGMVFGLFHVVNILYDTSYEKLIVQIITTSIVGVFFVVMYLYSNSIWAVIILHALFDLAAGLHQWMFCFSGSTDKLPFFWVKIFVNILFYVMGIVLIGIYMRDIRQEKRNKSK